jgi:hypothetical protein
MSDHEHDHDDEALDLDEILEDAPPEVREMVALSMGFAAALAAQNEILAQQRESLLQLAATTAEVAQDVLEWEEAGEEEGYEDDEPDLDDAVEQLRDAGSQIEESSRAALAVLQSQSAAVEQLVQQGASDDFRRQALAQVYQATGQALATALQNTVTAQQQLNQIGNAILTQAASVLLSLAGEEGEEEDEDVV